MLCHRLGTVPSDIGQSDTVSFAGGSINVVIAGGQHGDHSEFRKFIKYFGGDAELVDYQDVIATGLLNKFVLRGVPETIPDVGKFRNRKGHVGMFCMGFGTEYSDGIHEASLNNGCAGNPPGGTADAVRNLDFLILGNILPVAGTEVQKRFPAVMMRKTGAYRDNSCCFRKSEACFNGIGTSI